MFLGRIAPGEALCRAGLLGSVIIYLTLQNEVGKNIWGHVFNDLVFLDSDSMLLPETELYVAAHCKYCSSAVAF